MNLKQFLISVCLATGFAHAAADGDTRRDESATVVAAAPAAAATPAADTAPAAGTSEANAPAGDGLNVLLLLAGMAGMAAIGWARRQEG